MPKPTLDASDTDIGRFDRSFLIQMIRDFFILLVLVTVLEFSIKAGLVAYNFWANGEREAAEVAEEVAANVRSIMLNEGGPVAARTMYPILERNLTERGYEVAIVPAEITIAAIEEGFGYRPEGIPAGDWPDGTHRSATVEIEAEAFCLACHTTARVGDVIGAVTVRNYLGRDLAAWWEDVQLTAGFSIGKIVLHSVLLFILLRARLEPLLRLRGVVSRLARAYGGLHHRAEIRSRDEFGVLARDLNLFLDRITKLIDELDSVLRRVVAVNDDILTIQGDLRGKVDGLVESARKMERRAMLNARHEPRLSADWFEAMKAAITDLEARVARLDGAAGSPHDTARLIVSLRAVVDTAEAQIATNEALFEDLARVGRESERFQAAIAEMARLEERMQAIIETGGQLVRRLQPEAGGPEGGGPESASPETEPPQPGGSRPASA